MKPFILSATVLQMLLLSACSSTFNVGDSGKLSCPQSVKGMPCVTVRAARMIVKKANQHRIRLFLFCLKPYQMLPLSASLSLYWSLPV